MIKKIAIGLVVAVVAIVAVGFVLPSRWQVQRSVVIKAPPERIYPFLFDLRRWQDWTVWTKAMDPLLRNAYEGPQDGVGAKWIWMGPKMGRGQLEIVQAEPREGIVLDESIESERVNATASLRMSPRDDGTQLTWTDEGTLPPVVGGFFRGTVEEELGRSFETCLQKLKGLVEALPEPVVPKPPPSVDAGLPDAGP